MSWRPLRYRKRGSVPVAKRSTVSKLRCGTELYTNIVISKHIDKPGGLPIATFTRNQSLEMYKLCILIPHICGAICENLVTDITKTSQEVLYYLLADGNVREQLLDTSRSIKVTGTW